MEANRYKPRKGKRKADNYEEQKAKELALIGEAEAKRGKKEPASEIQSAKDLPAKPIQSKSSKRLGKNVEVALPSNLRSPRFRKGRKAKESISVQISSESSDNEEEAHYSYTSSSISKTVPIRNSTDSETNSSESTSGNKKQSQGFRKEKMNKDPISVKRNSSDSESTSDDEEDVPKFSKEKIIKQSKDPIYIQNSSDSESMSDDGEREIIKDDYGEPNLETKKENDSNVIMPKEDQLILIKRIQECIPDDDHRSYHCRLKKLDWHKVAFKDYTIDQCKQIWWQLFKKVRHYRLLEEITRDIQEIIKFNDLQAIKTNPTRKTIKRHPAMPDQPMSAYFIYYTENCDKLSKRRPDLHGIPFEKYIGEKYQRLSLEKKQKYDLMARKMREDYKVKLAKFYDEHPHVKKEKKIYNKNLKVKTEDPPKEPENAFGLFLASEIINQNPEDKFEFRKDCRKRWNRLPGSVKLPWMNRAEEENIEYQKKLGEYMARHPKFVPKKSKSGLTKEEKLLKAKLSGKPKKPPKTALHLFNSIILASAEIAPREAWKYCSFKWSGLSQEDKDRYTQLLKKRQRRYEIDFAKYLDTLPEDKRQEEIAQAGKKPRRKI